MKKTRIVFVYNAEAGFFNALADTAHKIFSPSTYPCSLCRFTYGLRSMVLPWKQFIDSLEPGPVFLHRTEFRAAYPGFDDPFPLVLLDRGGNVPEILLGASEIAEAGGVEGLIAAVKQKLATLS